MTDDVLARFAGWLAGQMKDRGISDRQLARLVGVSPTTPRTWRLGSSRPSYENCEGIARALKVSPATVKFWAGYEDGEEAPPEINPPWLVELREIGEALSDGERLVLLGLARSLRDSLVHLE